MLRRRGAYTADRAAALAGVPKSTVHYWARTGVLEPSVSPERVKLWSYTDLMGLRFIYWLRQPKRRSGADIPPTSMPTVRAALETLRALDLEPWSAGGPRLTVDRGGHVFVIPNDEELQEASGQLVAKGVLDLLGPFTVADGIRGPDLSAPRPRLRIIPGKLSGSPHVEGTRVETEALAALERRNFGRDRVRALYPYLDEEAVDQALDLEHQLLSNLRAA